MKILHTSDWHIGLKLYNYEIENEHKLFFDWLIETIQEHKIDVLIIAGDIFDTAYPSNSSLQLYYKTLYRIKNTNCKDIIIIGGNHDSVSTLNAPKQILEYLNIHVVGGISNNIENEIIEIKNENNEPGLVVCAVPFLRDKDIRRSRAGESYEDKANALREGISKHYAKLAELINPYKEKQIPVFATGHLFMAGASVTDSERDIYIGNLAKISKSHFPEQFDYIALGHIHRPQIVAKTENIRYSGSPLPLSFSERKDYKQVVVIDIDKNNPINITPVKIPEIINLKKVKGTYNEVVTELKVLDKELDYLVDIELFEEKYNPELFSLFYDFIEKLEKVKVINYKIIFEDKQIGADDIYEDTVSLRDMDITDVFHKLIDKHEIDNSDEIIDTFKELLNEIKF